MYKRILVPIDLTHTDKLTKALATSVDIARHYDAAVCYVTVTNSTPSAAAHSPKELAAKLSGFALEQAASHGIETFTLVIESTDIAVELGDKLLTAIEEVAADLVVMGSHSPGIGDWLHLLHSNAAHLVKHSEVSVFVVR